MTVGAECHAEHAAPAGGKGLADRQPGFGVPQTHIPVAARGRDPAAVWAERDIDHFAGVTN